MSLVEVIMGKMKQDKLSRQRTDLPERIIHLSIMLAMPSAILLAILTKMSAIT